MASDKGPGKEWAAYSRAHMSRGSPLSCYSCTMAKYHKMTFPPLYHMAKVMKSILVNWLISYFLRRDARTKIH